MDDLNLVFSRTHKKVTIVSQMPEWLKNADLEARIKKSILNAFLCSKLVKLLELEVSGNFLVDIDDMSQEMIYCPVFQNKSGIGCSTSFSFPLQDGKPDFVIDFKCPKNEFCELKKLQKKYFDALKLVKGY